MSVTELLIVAPSVGSSENFFTVDTSVIDVPILSRSNPIISQTLLDGNLKHLFQPVDNIQVISFGAFIPHLFVLSQQIQWTLAATSIDSGGSALTGVTELGGNNGNNFIEAATIGEEINQFVQTRQYHALRESVVEHLDTMFLTMVITSGRVSMLNVPSVMDTLEVDVRPFLKIKHNFNLVDVVTPA